MLHYKCTYIVVHNRVYSIPLHAFVRVRQVARVNPSSMTHEHMQMVTSMQTAVTFNAYSNPTNEERGVGVDILLSIVFCEALM